MQFSSFLPHVHIATFARTRTRAHPAILCFYLHMFTHRRKLFVNQLLRGEGFTPFLPSPLPSPTVLQLYSLFVFDARCAGERRAMACHAEG